MKSISLYAVMIAAFPALVLAQPSPPGPGGRPDMNRPGPWDNDAVVYRVDADGRSEKLATFERAGVPTLARLKDGRLIAAHQHFPKNDPDNFDKVAVRFSSDEGRTWTPLQVLRVDGLPTGMRFPFDPTLVPLPDGRVRLYFTGNFGRTFDRSTPNIRSAISTNGVDFTFEPGIRFEVAGKMIIDCAVALHQGVFHLFVPDNGVPPLPGQRPGQNSGPDRPRDDMGYHATSKDGLNFTREEDVRVEGGHRWLGGAESDGKQITFFGTAARGAPKPGQRRGGIWTGTSTNGREWQLAKFFDVPGADPGAVAARDGGWIVVVTGPPRAGTPNAQPRQQRVPVPPRPRGPQ